MMEENFAVAGAGSSGMGGSDGNRLRSMDGGTIGGVPPARAVADPLRLSPSGEFMEPALARARQLASERFLVTGLDLLNVSRMFWGEEEGPSAMERARRISVPKWATHFTGYAVNPDAQDLNEVFGELEHLEEIRSS